MDGTCSSSRVCLRYVSWKLEHVSWKLEHITSKLHASEQVLLMKRWIDLVCHPSILCSTETFCFRDETQKEKTPLHFLMFLIKRSSSSFNSGIIHLLGVCFCFKFGLMLLIKRSSNWVFFLSNKYLLGY
jgi:hypothetical protein